jgi:type VI secretion system protein ImpL
MNPMNIPDRLRGLIQNRLEPSLNQLRRRFATRAARHLLRIAISLIGAAAVAALIWFAGPLIAFGAARPLDDPGARFGAIAFEFVIIAGAAGLRLYRRRKAAEQIARGISVDDSDASVLTERMNEALTTLRSLRGGRANYLYDLPWYVLIGPPGSGKTTALINSGLEFPLAQGVSPGAISGVGGTRYCDWWFTEDAVLIDTAGRYTTQDSDSVADQKSWLAFLDLLKRYRPRQPINGVLVAISLEDLLTLGPKEIAAHADAIRARLLELHRQLKVDFPVYALFTKADLVIGFMEFFSNLNEAARQEVWGATFQTRDKAQNLVAEVPAEFNSLITRLNVCLPERLDEEKDATNRVLLFGFPAQMAALRGLLADFLSQIFDPRRYHIRASLRGFYFTSGTQQGTPIDQLLGALTKSFGAEGIAAPVFSGQGKSFFLTALIKQVVIGEAGWVSSGKGKGLVKLAGFSALFILTPLIVSAWWVNYARNGDLIDRSKEAVQTYGVLAGGLGRSSTIADRDLSKILPALHALRYLPSGYAEGDESVAGSDGFGLGQGARLRSASVTAYQTGLERLLRPRLVYRLEEQLEANANDPAFLYDALKVYLMIGIGPRLFIPA